MQWRSAWARFAALPLVLVIAACSQDNVGTGPRLANLSVVSGSSQTGPIGGLLPQPLVVRVQDQHGDPVADAVVTFAVSSGAGVLTATADTSGADGYAQTTFRLGPNLGVQTVTAALPGQNPVSFVATATSAPASKLTLVSGDGQTSKVGGTLGSDLVVKTTDAFDNPRAGIPVSFSVDASGGTVSASTVLSDVDGLASVKWTAGTSAGSHSVTATSGSISPVTFTALITSDQPSGIVALSGNNQTGTGGSPLTDSVAVKVVDQYGNGVAGVTVDWVLTSADGTTSPTSSVTSSTGRATTRWFVGAGGGPKSLTAQVGSLSVKFAAAVPVNYVAISTGGSHTCGIGVGGIVYCWGFNGDAELGIGALAQGSGPIFATPQPAAATGNWTFRDISTGTGHSCAVALTGEAFCWGSNVDGRIGQESHTQERFDTPTQVKTTYTFVSITSGRAHNCGIGFSTRPVCWGSNHEGETGVQGGMIVTTDSSTIDFPNYVNNPVYGLGAISIAAGGVHGCAATASGQTYCWGNNTYGQLGDGTNTRSPHPTLVSGGTPFVAVAAGGYHSCALDTAGGAWCWGLNVNGQLGDGTNTTTNAPVAVAGSLVLAKIAAGADHSCGLTAAGVAYCWGNNDSGQLGDGTTNAHSAPVAVAGGLAFKGISTGQSRTCGVTYDNLAYCWGDNQFGALGDGTLTNRLAPTKVHFQP